MRNNRQLIIFSFLFAIFLLIGCSELNPESTDLPTEDQKEVTQENPEIATSMPEVSDTPPTEVIPTATEEVPTDAPPSRGQIVYVFGGEVWRYLVDMNSTEQITSGSSGFYSNLKVSGDGAFAAYNRDDMIHILNLGDSSEQLLGDVGAFVNWGEGDGEIYTFESDLTCEDFADDIQNQDMINYDVLRVNISDPSSFITLANIPGGMRLPEGIYNYGTWASMASCGCYSECGGFSLWYLPTVTQISHPDVGLNAGGFSFSPDFSQVTFSNLQMYGYFQSPLYVSDPNYTSSSVIYNEANVAVVEPMWSPAGDWIAFTGINFDDSSMEITNSRVILIRSDGSEQRVVESDMGWLVDWSPDGQYLLYRREGSPSDTFTIYSLMDASKTLLPFTADEYRPVDWGYLP
jgi:hypothetical protein